MSSPLNNTLPLIGFKKPKIIFTKVVLPEPDSPTIPIQSPFKIFKDKLSIIFILSYPKSKFFNSKDLNFSTLFCNSLFEISGEIL